LAAGALPAGLAPLINQHSANQELIIEAALTQDVDLAFQAFFNDPSIPLPLDDAWELFNKLLQAQTRHRDRSSHHASAEPIPLVP
jgi:alpha-galactosidase